LKVGVLSDTHLPARTQRLPEDVLSALADVDLIIHAGDFVRPEVLSSLTALHPVHAVQGNVDDPELRRALPRQRVLTVGGFRIGVVHGDWPMSSPLERARKCFAGDDLDCVVFGHSHLPYCT
jgi:putative phosphoesterase